MTLSAVAVPGASVASQVSRLPKIGAPTPPTPADLDVPDATFACPDLTTFCRLEADSRGNPVVQAILRAYRLTP